MFNQYGIIPVSPEHCPDTHNEDGLVFTKWMISKTGQGLIKAYQRAGEQLFFPNADGQ
jgi:tungstate transport system substrate-binding protein